MSETLVSITLNDADYINVNEKLGIPAGVKIYIHNIGSSDVYASVLDQKPPRNNERYQVIKPDSVPFTNEQHNGDVWLFSPNQNAKVNVSVRGGGLKPFTEVYFSSEESQKLARDFFNVFYELVESNKKILLEMRLLNERFEEANETKIYYEDIDNGSDR